MTSTTTTDVWGHPAGAPARQSVPERRARQLSGLPPRPQTGGNRWLRLLRNRWTWLTLVLVQLYAFGLWRVWSQMHADRELPDGSVIPGFDWATVVKCAKFAAPTAIAWSLFFVLVDRLRPMRPLYWLLAFGWGSCMSIWLSLNINTWAAEMLNVSAAPGDPGAAARPAVFVAPFVEEASKATFLFLLAILLRHRMVSRLQAVSLAGLSAIGFAFTENIVYYARAWIYGSMTIGTGDVEQQVRQLVWLRGFWTSFGHPTFTMLTGIGLAIGIRHRSKLVRILAPLTGFALSALGHMFFNGMSSVGAMNDVTMKFAFAIVVFTIVSAMVRAQAKEHRRVRDRLTDYVRMGWLSPRDPIVYGSIRRRFWLSLVSLFRGPRTWWRTQQLMRHMTDLAYLRDSMVRGVVDEAGIEVEKELLGAIRALRPVALSESDGLRLTLNLKPLMFWRRREPGLPASSQQWAPPSTQQWAPPGR